jgi:hypothetical protein
MFFAQADPHPCCEITHTPVSSPRPVSLTRRGKPDVRLIVSNSTVSDEPTPIRSNVATIGFITALRNAVESVAAIACSLLLPGRTRRLVGGRRRGYTGG